MSDQNSSPQKHNILIVDDDATICLLMKEALTDDDITVTEVNNGIDALTQIKTQQPDLVLLDVTMPGMDGFAVCKEIRRLYGDTNISIIMVTALEDSASIEKSYDLGATDFISKPINWDTLPYRVKYLLKARNAIREMQQHKSHLEYMEHIARIITQNQHIDIICQETLSAMLEYFSANHAMLIKPDEIVENTYVVECEAASDSIDTCSYLDNSITDLLEENILSRASISVYPIVSRYGSTSSPPLSNQSLKQQMICSLHINKTNIWYLIIQQSTVQENWTIQDAETFYKISLRLTNILSRHLLTEKLKRSESLFKQALDISHLGSWYWSTASNILTWSDEVYQIYGLSPQSYSPEFDTYFEVVFEEDADRLRFINSIKNKISTSFQIDHRIRLPDKRIRWIHEQCIAKYDHLGNLQEINGIVQDITDARIKMEQEAHNSKMESIGQLTSGIAHDFGNLMTVAKGNLDLLKETMLNQDDIRQGNNELLEDALSAVNDSVSLTKQLLYFSRKKSIAPVNVNIEQALDKCEMLFKNSVGENISISLDIEPNICDIFVDPNQLQNALLNIIINAKNAMPDGGEIQIDVKMLRKYISHGPISNTEHEIDDEYVCILITDNGTGMTNNVVERAIEPFYTTQINQGTGLGLSMVYSFIKQSGGDLDIQSEPEKGTTISLFFPRHSGVAINKTNNEKVAIKSPSLKNTHATILIVEDRHTVRQFAIRCLMQTGLKILQAEDAAAAQDMLQTNHVDLLFTDIVMPGEMDGNKLAEWAAKKYPDLEILLTTAMDNKFQDITGIDNDADKLSETKHFKMLIKPYTKYELINNIERLLQTQPHLR